MNVTEAPFIQEFIRLCQDGWRMGWHEYHGGNLSYRLTEDEIELVKGSLKLDAEWKHMELSFPSLREQVFLVTGSGECFRDAVAKPMDNFGIVQLNGKGDCYRVLWGLMHNGRKPTSEFLSHLQIHEIKRNSSGDSYRIVYHSHPSNIIALSFILPSDSKSFSRELWDMEPECAMVFPDGIGVIPWMVPGTAELAGVTGELMKTHDVALWAQHGLLVASTDMSTALGVTNTVEKAAEILIKILATGRERFHVSNESYSKLAEVFHLNIKKEYLADG